jgi:hypothetical protein
VVEAAAAAHRVFLERPQPRRGLARAADASAGAFDAADEFLRRGRHAREVAEQVERDALGREHGTRRALERHQRRLARYARAVASLGRDRGLGGELGEGGGGERQAGDHARLARDHDRARARACRDGRDRGHIPGAAEVLGERARDHRVDLERRQEGVGAEQGGGH